jgi:hypothetical protein
LTSEAVAVLGLLPPPAPGGADEGSPQEPIDQLADAAASPLQYKPPARETAGGRKTGRVVIGGFLRQSGPVAGTAASRGATGSDNYSSWGNEGRW